MMHMHLENEQPPDLVPTTKIAAFFDVDQTLIRGASSYHLAKELYRQGFFGFKDLFFAFRHSVCYLLLGEDLKRIDKVTERALKIMQGHSEAEVAQLGEEVYQQVLSHHIFPGTKKILDAHIAAGHEVWLISATPTTVAGLLAKRMGATGYLGTKIATHNGKFLAKLDGPMLHREGKAGGVRRLAKERELDLAGSYAYADSHNDLPMMALVGNPRAINPEPRLRLVASEMGWPIHDFRRRRPDLRRAARRSAIVAGLWIIKKSLENLRNGYGNKRNISRLNHPDL